MKEGQGRARGCSPYLGPSGTVGGSMASIPLLRCRCRRCRRRRDAGDGGDHVSDPTARPGSTSISPRASPKVPPTTPPFREFYLGGTPIGRAKCGHTRQTHRCAARAAAKWKLAATLKFARISVGRPKPGSFFIVEMAPPHPSCARSALPEGAERPAGAPRSGAERRRRRTAQDAKFSAIPEIFPLALCPKTVRFNPFWAVLTLLRIINQPS